MKRINLENSQGFGLGLEEEQNFIEFAKTETTFDRHLYRASQFLVKKMGYMPYLFIGKQNVDEKAVEEFLKHPEYLRIVADWIENNNKDDAVKLKDAKKVFEAIQTPPKLDKVLYRGFGISSGQQTHGLDRQALDELNPGETFEDTPGRAVSFSSSKDIGQAYGNILVTVDYESEVKRMFHITNEVLVATFMNEDGETDVQKTLERVGDKLFSYYESIFLPDDKPLEFTLVHKA